MDNFIDAWEEYKEISGKVNEVSNIIDMIKAMLFELIDSLISSIK